MAKQSTAPRRLSRSELWKNMNIPDYLRPKVKSIFDDGSDQQKFLQRLGHIHPPGTDDYNLILRANDCALASFEGQHRANGEPVHEHLRWTALITADYLGFDDAESMCTALLHDTGEDDPRFPHRRLLSEFGPRIGGNTWHLTQQKPRHGETDEEAELRYYHGLGKCEEVRVIAVKGSDRLHNMFTIWAHDHDKIAKKVLKTKYLLLPILRERRVLYHEMVDTIRLVEKRFGL